MSRYALIKTLSSRSHLKIASLNCLSGNRKMWTSGHQVYHETSKNNCFAHFTSLFYKFISSIFSLCNRLHILQQKYSLSSLLTLFRPSKYYFVWNHYLFSVYTVPFYKTFLQQLHCLFPLQTCIPAYD